MHQKPRRLFFLSRSNLAAPGLMGEEETNGKKYTPYRDQDARYGKLPTGH